MKEDEQLLDRSVRGHAWVSSVRVDDSRCHTCCTPCRHPYSSIQTIAGGRGGSVLVHLTWRELSAVVLKL